MPISKLEKERLIYIVYHRKDYTDFNQLREKLVFYAKRDSRDIAVDFSRNPSLSDGEIGMLIKAAKRMAENSRKLLTILSNASMEALDNNELIKAENVTIFTDHNSFLTELNSV